MGLHKLSIQIYGALGRLDRLGKLTSLNKEYGLQAPELGGMRMAFQSLHADSLRLLKIAVVGKCTNTQRDIRLYSIFLHHGLRHSLHSHAMRLQLRGYL